MKNWLHRFFIDGLSGMALGLFATLIVGTILSQGGLAIGGRLGEWLQTIGKTASIVTGAGIGCGVASKYKESPLVVLSGAVCGMVGAFASGILAGTFVQAGTVGLSGPGEPLGAFLAAYVGIEVGHLISGKTKVDILVTPILSILSGSLAGLLIGPPISTFMKGLGNLVNWGTEQQPFLMGIVVSVLMGMILTLPISSAAIGIVLSLSGLAAGAATVGCCANMIGFAVASYRENRFGGFLAQGLGTSMLQVPNIMKRPLIWLPAILTSAILGPVSTLVFHMTNSATGSGMGTAGLVGPILTYQTMIATESAGVVIGKIVLMYFLLPGALAFVISEGMRKLSLVKPGDMKLSL